MKHLLVTAATAAEIAPFTGFLEAHYPQPEPGVFQLTDYRLHILISGVGMMATAFALGQSLVRQRYDAALQAGIAGTFDKTLPLATVVGIASEAYGDLGAEDHDRYLDIFSLGLLDAQAYPFREGRLWNDDPLPAAKELPLLHSISVNTVSGAEQSIAARAARHGCSIESMEGIAFHYACLKHNIPFLQVRALSNYVTPRDRASWQIGPAIGSLNHYLQQNCTHFIF